MRAVEVPPRLIAPGRGIRDSFDVVFGAHALQTMHGDSVRYGEWNNDKRRVGFAVPVNLPSEFKRFFCGDKLRITTHQERHWHPDGDRVDVKNRMRMHFVGAELFSVRPSFSLTQHPDGTHISCRVEHRARLPPPLNMLAEATMADHTRRELEKFEVALKKFDFGASP